MGRVRGGGKRRRLVMDDSSPSPQPAPASPSLPPGAPSSPPPQPTAPVIDPLAAMLEEAMDAPTPPPPTPRVLRPYASQVPYSLTHPSKGSRGRLPLHRRPLCPQTLQGMSMADLIATMEHVGFLPPRPCCPICETPFSLDHLRTRSRQEELTLPGGLTVHHTVQLAMWYCPNHVELSIFTGAELLNPRWSLLQNALLLWHWAQPQEPSSDTLAQLVFVDRRSLLEGGRRGGRPGREGWLTRLRKFVAERQERADMAAQVGGVGVDTEADEVSFRAKGHRHEDGRLGVLWLRYICFAERGSRHLLLRFLGARFVANAGQGGGGGLSDEELLRAVFCGLLPVFRDGSVVHTDSAQAYISLGQAEPSLEAAPAEVQEAMASIPPQSDGVSFSWRMETQQEADERATAEAKADPVVRRKAAWAAHYAHLRLAHSMVCHTKKRGQKVQFAAIRRVLLHPDVAAALQEAEADPFLQDCHTWRVAGTMKVDGYWTILRRRVAQRSYKTSSLEALLRAVRIHQWSYWCGPGACLFSELGAMVRAARDTVQATPAPTRELLRLRRLLVPAIRDREDVWLARRLRCQTAGLATAKSKAKAKRLAAAGPPRPQGRPRRELLPQEPRPKGRPRAPEAPEEERRPRGRPRREEPPEEERRPRGRPRGVQPAPVEPRPRGRPRGDPVPEAQRPRGRPRLVAPPAQETSTEPALYDPRADPVRWERSRFQHLAEAERAAAAAEQEAEVRGAPQGGSR